MSGDVSYDNGFKEGWEQAIKFSNREMNYPSIQAQQARIERLEAALRFYAEATPIEIGSDRGKRARAALEEKV